MKRILSVILSLALLASALIIPMSVSAEVAEAETSAAQAVINAVNGLKVDLNAVNPIELAVPVDSRTAVDDNTWSSSTGDSVSTNKITIEDSTDPTVGTKTVKVNEDNPVTATAWGLKAGDLHAIKYSVNVPAKMSYVKDIDYIVVYVKTNRSFKMRLSTHNGYSYANAITDDIQVDANDTYQPVVLSLRDGFAKKYQSLYSIDHSFTRGFYLSIASMIDGENTIADSDITFGSILYVPGDTAARDFKYDLSTTRKVTDRFTAANGLSADMIIAAEKIENDGRYTAASFASLQSAISAAKEVFINNATDDEVVGLFKEEVARLYKLEEVFRPKFVETGANEGSLASTQGDISNLGLTADQQNSFGEYVAKATSANTHVHFVDANANSRYPGDNTYLKTYANYKNLYLAVYNTGNAFETTGFSFYNNTDSATGIALVNKVNKKFALHNGYYLYDLYSTSVINYEAKFLLDFASTKGITQANRVQVILDKAIPADENVYFGSILGEVAFNTSTIDTVVTDKATLVSFYANNIANKGYENSAAVEETMELLGITTVEVVKVLDDSIGIKYPENPEYTLETAAIDHNVSFSLTNIPTGATVTVKYGDDVITDDNGDGYYEITVAKGKVLTIIPSCLTTEYTKANITSRFSRDNNVALNVIPKLYQTTTTRTERLLKDAGSLDKLSNGDLSGGDVTFGFTFKKNENGAYTNYLNNYKPGQKFNFNQESYDAYVDLVYDLGRPTDINKFQHIAASDSALGMGVYQLYASDSATNLFSKDSLICNYQKIDIAQKKYSQEIEFPTQTAQYVAIRCYMPIVESDGTDNYYYNCFRIGDIAIYGTPTNDIDYEVTEIQAPTNTTTSIATGSILNSNTLKSIKGYENDKEIENITINSDDTHQVKLHNSILSGHGDFYTGVFYDTKFKNGFVIDRTSLDGNVKFREENAETTIYSEFTYDLKEYYYIDRFELYSVIQTDSNLRTQAYEVYIGNDLDTLYKGKPVAVYNNYYNTFGQKIAFDQAKLGKYLGVRILMPADRKDSANYVRLNELAAYGDKVTSATDENLKPKGGLSSESVFLWNKDNSSVYTGDDDVTEYTAARLSVKYQSPLGENGIADTSKICLANGKSANIVERNVIAISKEKYTANSLTTLDISTAGAKHSTATGEALNKCWKTNGQDVYAVFNLNNIKSTQIDYEFVVTGRIVYEYNGTYYTEYSSVFGDDFALSAQSAFTAQFGTEYTQDWFTKTATEEQ